jgi:hypothetical protein
MFLKIDYDKYLVVLPGRYEKSKFLKAAQVLPGSYAQDLMERIYDSLIVYAVDLWEEYTRYYSAEYSGIEDFLYWKYDLAEDTIVRAMKNMSNHSFLGFCTDRVGLITVDSMLEALDELFALLERDR